MNFAELPPSEEWAALTFKGERIAEVWFKPQSDPSGLVFRIPQRIFQLHGMAQRLTAERLLNAVGIATDEVESWHYGSAAHAVFDASAPETKGPLPPPDSDMAHLAIHVRMKPPPKPAADKAHRETANTSTGEWHDLEVKWKTLLSLESTVDGLRNSVESVRSNLESAMRRTLTADEKTHALAADLAQWNKAKSRAHFALPKASEFIHRATWAAGTPERKRLGELFKNPIGTHTPLPDAHEVLQEIDSLRKDWQVLSASGTAVYQECRSNVADVDSALRRLQINAKARASQKKDRSSGPKSASF